MQLIGILLPALIDYINRKVLDSDKRFWVSVGVCVVVGTLLNFIQTLFVFSSLTDALESVSTTILMIFGVAQLTYRGFYKESQIRTDIKKIM